MNHEVLEKWKRNLVELEIKVEKLNNDKKILINLLDEIKVKQNVKLNILLKDLELEEELSTFKGWIEFEVEKISRLRNKITELEKELSQKEVEEIKKKAGLKELTETKEIGKEEIEVKEEKETEKEPTKELFKFISKEIKKEPVKEEILEVKEEDPIKEEPIEKEIIQEKEIPEIKVEEKEEIIVEEEPEPDVKKEIKVEDREIDEKVLEQQLLDLEKEPKDIFEKKEVEQKEFDGALVKDILTKEDLEKEEEVKEQIKELFVEKEIIRKPIKLKDKFELIKKPIIKLLEKTKKFDGQKLIGKTLKLKEKIEAIKKPVVKVFERVSKLERQKIIKYALPVILLVFFVSVLFVSKPEITGYVVLTEEKTIDDNLNLVINESGNYTWTADQIGNIESIRASGRTIGNGTVKIYIEKNGERFLIYDNKANIG